MLNFEPGTLVWTLLAFGLAYAVVAWKVYPLLSAFLAERRSRIESSLAEADKNRTEAAALQASIDEKMREAGLEEFRILSDAREKARGLSAAAEQKAQEHQRELQKKQQEDLARAEREFVKDSRERIARLVLTTCERILRTELSQEQHRRIIEERIRDFERMRF